MDDRSLVPNISIGKVILACAPHENPAVVQNNNKYFQLPSFGDKTIPASEPANVTTLSKIVFRLPIISFDRVKKLWQYSVDLIKRGSSLDGWKSN